MAELGVLMRCLVMCFYVQLRNICLGKALVRSVVID
jgi:hypothetical protein